MKRTVLLVFAYICIWSTPIQIVFVLWALGIAITTDLTIFSLTNDIFISEYVSFIYEPLKAFTYLVFPDCLADFIWGLPVFFHQLLKSVVTTILGFWLLRVAIKMPKS